MSYASGVFVGLVPDDVEQIQNRYPGDFYEIEVFPLAGVGPATDPDAPGRVPVSILPSHAIGRVQPGPGARVICRKTAGGGWYAERLALRLEVGPLLGYQGQDVTNGPVLWEINHEWGSEDQDFRQVAAGDDGVASWVIHREKWPDADGVICRPLSARVFIDSVDTQVHISAVSGMDNTSGPLATRPAGTLAWAPCYKMPLLPGIRINDAATGAQKAAMVGSSVLSPGIFANYFGDASGVPPVGGYKIDFNGAAPVLTVRLTEAPPEVIAAAAHHGPPDLRLLAGAANRFQATFPGASLTYTAQE